MKIKIAGLSLLRRHLLTWKRAGADRMVVAAGEQSRQVEKLASRARKDGIPVEVVREVGEPPKGQIVIEHRADLLISPKLAARLAGRLREIQEAPGLKRPRAIECVDRWEGNHPVEEKSPYKVGVASDLDLRFVGDGEDKFHSMGLKASLPGGRASTARMDVGRHFWHRVASREDRKPAARKVLLATMKATDGIYARTNRRVSFLISRLLLPTPVTPNMVTVFTFFASLATGILYGMGTYPSMLLGAFMGWFSSMMDGVDGELARARFQESDFGCWLEMVCDYLFYVFLLTGMGVGVWRMTGNAVWLAMGLESVLAAVAAFGVVALQRRRYGEEGEDVGEYGTAFQKRVEKRQSKSSLHFLTRKLTFMATRAAAPYWIFVLTALGLVKTLLALSFIGTNVALILAASATKLFGRGAPDTGEA